MAIHRWQDLKHKVPAAQRAQIRGEVASEILQADLKGIREVLGKTQVEVAEALEMTQGQVSETERREDHRLSTLRRDVEALGGRLEVIARFGDKSIRLLGV